MGIFALFRAYPHRLIGGTVKFNGKFGQTLTGAPVVPSDPRKLPDDKRLPRWSLAQALNSLLWLEHAIVISGVSRDVFARLYVDESGRGSNLMYKWRRRDSLPSARKVRRMEKALPGTSFVYFLPLRELFEPSHLTVDQVSALQRPYLKTCCGESYWTFPNDDQLRALDRYEYEPTYEDPGALMRRGDLCGLVAIISMVREAEALADTVAHRERCAWMYRALPAVAREPWVRPYLPLLTAGLDHLSARLASTADYFDVDWGVIQRQIDADSYETLRHRRPRDPATQRHQDLEDPIAYTLLLRAARWLTPPPSGLGSTTDVPKVVP